MENNNNNRKYYTFLDLKNCVTKDGKSFAGVTAILNISNIETAVTPAGKKVVTGRAAINNRNTRINTALNTNFDKNEDVVWSDVQFWEERADRFEKFLGDRSKIRLVITGSIRVREFERNDGSKGQRLTINVDDWALAGGNASNAASNNEAAPQFTEKEEPHFETLGADDDLPF